MQLVPAIHRRYDQVRPQPFPGRCETRREGAAAAGGGGWGWFGRPGGGGVREGRTPASAGKGGQRRGRLLAPHPSTGRCFPRRASQGSAGGSPSGPGRAGPGRAVPCDRPSRPLPRPAPPSRRGFAAPPRPAPSYAPGVPRRAEADGAAPRRQERPGLGGGAAARCPREVGGARREEVGGGWRRFRGPAWPGGGRRAAGRPPEEARRGWLPARLRGRGVWLSSGLPGAAGGRPCPEP